MADGERVDQIRALEGLKAAASAAQARLSAGLFASVHAGGPPGGAGSGRVGRGGHAGGRWRGGSRRRVASSLGLARALTAEMPHTLAALAGWLEWRATFLVRETACLSVADQRARWTRSCARTPPPWRGWAIGGGGRRRKRSPTGWTRTRWWTAARRAERGAADLGAGGAGHDGLSDRAAAGRAGGRVLRGAGQGRGPRCWRSGDPRTRAQLMADLGGANG